MQQTNKLDLKEYREDYKASLELVEPHRDFAVKAASEFASIGIRFGYILNASGLVVIPAIMELLPDQEIERSFMILPAILFAIGILMAAVTNYLVYYAMIKRGEALSFEMLIRALDVQERHFGQTKEFTDKKLDYGSQRSKALKLSKCCSKLDIYFAFLTIGLFQFGVFRAIWVMMQL